MSRRVEAPRTLNDRPSLPFVRQTLDYQTRENGQVDGQSPHRQVAILFKNNVLKAAIPDSCPFKIAEGVYQPTAADLVGK